MLIRYARDSEQNILQIYGKSIIWKCALPHYEYSIFRQTRCIKYKLFIEMLVRSYFGSVKCISIQHLWIYVYSDAYKLYTMCKDSYGFHSRM